MLLIRNTVKYTKKIFTVKLVSGDLDNCSTLFGNCSALVTKIYFFAMKQKDNFLCRCTPFFMYSMMYFIHLFLLV